MATRPKVSADRLREIVKEEVALVKEALDHAGIRDVVNGASKLLAAVEAFKEKAPPGALNAVTPCIGQLEKALEDMVATPGSYVMKVKVEPKKVSLRAVKGEGVAKKATLSEIKDGDRVVIKDAPGGMPMFVGKTGVVRGHELDGRTKLFRVYLDEPVVIPGLGPVTDDLWTAQHLKVVRG